MKTANDKFTIYDLRFTIEAEKPLAFCRSIGHRQLASAQPGSAIGNRRAFTLIELLVVISIMAVLAGFALAVVHQIKKQEYISTARAELGQIESALKDYHNQYGVYPPSNPLNPLTNTLYYELSGVTNFVIGGTTYYKTLDGASKVDAIGYADPTMFNVGGAINTIKVGDTESAKARSFLPALKPNRIGTITNSAGTLFNLLVTSMRGPDTRYQPLGFQDANPFRYLYPGTNNPTSYDLWIQLVISGKTNLICNWGKSVIINSPLP